MSDQYRNAEDFVCDESFQRYCLGTDPSATDFWENWIKEHPEASGEITEARKLFSMLNANQGNLEQQVRELKDGMERSMLLKEGFGQLEARSRRPRRWLYAGVAAAVLIVAGTFFLTDRPAGKPAAVLPVAVSTVKTGDEPRKTLMLADGSILTMRNNTTVSLSEGFSKTNRVLSLSGEAFFDVKPDPEHPFIVHTKDASIEVLGTVFNVSAYPGNAYTETALFRGRVEVTSKEDPSRKTVLMPSQKLVIQSGGRRDTSFAVRSLAVDPVDHKAKEIAWIRSRLKIQDESLEQIAQRLEQWYGISIVFTDEAVKQYSYSGTFESETVIKALEALQLSYPFNFVAEQDRIVISK
ncbi:FecR family protein [Chitinophaga sp. GCM10012297]|uniref:FecR domain-containing protein n=1 Tax=Chitinophaga chungangae TaxID=2821488 RepID=A0ABS3Y8H7_9BACT|nr:FecR domain-containing protein [Chitinophaga chungangae]MBO9150979.1 FecR domain-containing protein [Chitinophaga chungangae]